MDIGVTIASDVFKGWKDLTVKRSIHSICGTFDFTAADVPIGTTDSIVIGAPCVVTMFSPLYEQVLDTGYVTKTRRTISSNADDVQFSGRSKTCDLVDCSVIGDKNNWRKAKLSKICSRQRVWNSVRRDGICCDRKTLPRIRHLADVIDEWSSATSQHRKRQSTRRARHGQEHQNHRHRRG